MTAPSDTGATPATAAVAVDLPLSADEGWEAAALPPGETGATPPEAPLDMPVQDLRARPPRGPDPGLPRLGFPVTSAAYLAAARLSWRWRLGLAGGVAIDLRREQLE